MADFCRCHELNGKMPERAGTPLGQPLRAWPVDPRGQKASFAQGALDLKERHALQRRPTLYPESTEADHSNPICDGTLASNDPLGLNRRFRGASEELRVERRRDVDQRIGQQANIMMKFTHKPKWQEKSKRM